MLFKLMEWLLLTPSPNNKIFHIHALVGNDLDVYVLTDIPFIRSNYIGIRPFKHQVTIGNSTIIQYVSDDCISTTHHVRHAQAFVLRIEPSTKGQLVRIIHRAPSTKNSKYLACKSTLSMKPRNSAPDWFKLKMLEVRHTAI